MSETENTLPPLPAKSGCRFPRPCSGECCDERYENVTITAGLRP